MIHILDNYYVSADSYCYTALINTHKKGKDNNIIYKTIGYYQNIKLAVEGIAKYMHRKLASENFELELNEYLKSCKDINDQIENILNKIEDTITF